MYCALPISFTQAILGAEISFQSLDGKSISFAVPQGTVSGKLLKIRGKGVPYTANADHAGDLYVKIVVQTPSKISQKEKELLQQYRDLEKPSDKPLLIKIDNLNM